MNILWQPSQNAYTQSHMAKFMLWVNQQYHTDIHDYSTLHAWSINHMADFWQAVWQYCQLIAQTPATQTMVPADHMQNTQWFPGCTLNFAQNLLQRTDDHLAIIYAAENGDRIHLSYQQLQDQVFALAHYLRTLGVTAGDRIAGFLPNRPETVVAMLATTSLGAIWTSCSPDFGLDGLLNRFGQIKPKILFATDGHYYKGKTYQHLPMIAKLQDQLVTLTQTIVVSHINQTPDIRSLHSAVLFPDALQVATQSTENPYTAVPFNHPALILYSSGTTGKPKCMVHSVGGTLIQHAKELILHTNLQANETIFFFTTCGWMMWNWLVSSLAVGATIVLYEGAPTHPKPDLFFDLIDELHINILGIGAQYLENCAHLQLTPGSTHQLHSLRSILTTASPLLPESFDYVYQQIKPDVQLSSISGGSDIISCFALGNPILPVYRGELQCIGLGMDVAIYNNAGQPVVNEKGELVCQSPFPAMPVCFWDDPAGKKYHQAYFAKHPNIWTHGDYALLNDHGGVIIYGRSDATLNTGGIRIGTAEIYNQVEKITGIIGCAAINQNWHGHDRTVLFVVLQNGQQLTSKLIQQIQTTIRTNMTPRHVPAKIIQAPDLPRTLNGKLAELAIKKAIQGEPTQNITALANPECLTFFKNIQWD